MANKKFNSWIKNICMGWGFIMAGSMLSSCNDLMHDDLPPCDMGVDLQFKYDYNVQRADMFKDHVGGLSVFVYDEQGNFIARHDAYNDATSQPLKDPNYAMRINLEPGKYRFATFAFQKKYEDALAQPGAKFQIALPQQGDNITALHARLDREQGKVNNQSQPLDTLWQGLSNELVEVKDLQVTRHTIGLVRDTKQLTISLHHTGNAGVGISSEERFITHGEIKLDGNLTDVIAVAFVLLPYMLQIGRSDETEIIVAYHLLRISNDSSYSLCILYKVQLVHRMVMDRISKLLLMPVCNIEHIFTHQRCYLVYDSSIFCHGTK